jgi:hypothetical protein
MKKILSVFLCLTMIFSMFAMNASAFTAGGECKDGNCEYLPTIIIPGLGQSNTWLADENGVLLTDDAGNYIKSGNMVGTALQQIALITETAVKEADDYLNGTAPAEEKQLVPCIAITADNVANLSQFVYEEGGAAVESVEEAA